jgi:hypothetical protein
MKLPVFNNCQLQSVDFYAYATDSIGQIAKVLSLKTLDNVTPADMYCGRFEQILAERQKSSHTAAADRRRPGAHDSSKAKKPPAVIFIRNYIALKSFSFHRCGRPSVSVHFQLTIYSNKFIHFLGCSPHQERLA